MNKQIIEMNLNDPKIVQYEVDICEMESKCSVYQIADAYLSLKKCGDDTYCSTVTKEEEEYVITIHKKSNMVYINDEPSSIGELISVFTNERESKVIERVTGLKEKDFVCRVYFKDGTIALKDRKGEWYVYC